MLHCAFGYTPGCMLFKDMFVCFSSFFENLGQGLIGSWLKFNDIDYTVITSDVMKMNGLAQILQKFKTEL